jgi:hypothetical protein
MPPTAAVVASEQRIDAQVLQQSYATLQQQYAHLERELALKYEIDAAPSQRHSLTLLLTSLQPLSLSLCLCPLSVFHIPWMVQKQRG